MTNLLKLVLEKALIWSTGLKTERYRQWVQVVRDEARVLSAQKIAILLGRGVLGLGGTPKTVWKRRIRACMRCPVYDRSRKTCRPYHGAAVGCGCYMPLKAKVREGACWVRQVAPGSPFGH